MYDIKGASLFPTPVLEMGITKHYHGLHDYMKEPPDYTLMPHSNTVIIIDLHKFGTNGQFRGTPENPDLRTHE